MKIKLKKLDSNALGLLSPENPNDAGMDICSNIEILLHPNKPTKISTGIAIQIPDGTVALVWDKSSMGARGIKTLGGVIDAGYRGEIFIVLINLTNEEIFLEKGKKLAQIVLQKYEKATIEVVDELGDGDRGYSNFGSSGE